LGRVGKKLLQRGRRKSRRGRRERKRTKKSVAQEPKKRTLPMKIIAPIAGVERLNQARICAGDRTRRKALANEEARTKDRTKKSRQAKKRKKKTSLKRNRTIAWGALKTTRGKIREKKMEKRNGESNVRSRTRARFSAKGVKAREGSVLIRGPRIQRNKKVKRVRKERSGGGWRRWAGKASALSGRTAVGLN